MGFFSAMKGANNVWGTVISADGIGTIGPANLVNNTEHKLMVTIGFKTTSFTIQDVQSITLIAATSEWIKYFIVLKNGKRFTVIFMMITAAKSSKTPISASYTGKEINVAVRNFEWWMFDLIYSPQKCSLNGNIVYSGNTDCQTKDNATVLSSNGQNKSDKTIESSLPMNHVTKAAPHKYWICKKCGCKNPTSLIYCRDCGEYK